MIYTFVWPRDQTFGPGLSLGAEILVSLSRNFGLGLVILASASTFWPRPWGQHFGLIWPQCQSFASAGLDTKCLASTSV